MRPLPVKFKAPVEPEAPRRRPLGRALFWLMVLALVLGVAALGLHLA